MARARACPLSIDFNDRQQEAAQFGSGPLLIIAGAGTGKTNTLAHRVAHLVLAGAKPDAHPAAHLHPARGARDDPPHAAHRRRTDRLRHPRAAD